MLKSFVFTHCAVESHSNNLYFKKWFILCRLVMWQIENAVTKALALDIDSGFLCNGCACTCPITANALAKAIEVAANRITAILKDERGITGDTALRLGTFFNTSAEFWMNLQMTCDLRNAEKALPARARKSIEDNRSVLT